MRIHAALIQGVIARISNNIPRSIFICGCINSTGDSMIPTLNIIKGMLNNITITPPIAKFLSFNKFIELEIDDNAVNIGEPIEKVNNNNKILSVLILSIKQATGITNRKGT